MRESRDLVFRVCSGAGGFLGLVYALHHHDAQPVDCAGKTAEFSRCVDHTLPTGVLAFLLPIFCGVIAGAIVGALLASRIRSRDRHEKAARSCGSPGRPLVALSHDQGGGDGHWLQARYAGSCDNCRATITPGDRIRHAPGRNVCERWGVEGSL